MIGNGSAHVFNRPLNADSAKATFWAKPIVLAQGKTQRQEMLRPIEKELKDTP
jgi:hypothetical protein